MDRVEAGGELRHTAFWIRSLSLPPLSLSLSLSISFSLVLSLSLLSLSQGEVVVHPSITPDDPLIKSAIEQVRFRISGSYSALRLDTHTHTRVHTHTQTRNSICNPDHRHADGA